MKLPNQKRGGGDVRDNPILNTILTISFVVMLILILI